MLSKNEIKDIQSLSQKKFREALKLFVAEGPKIVTAFLETVPDQISKIYGTADWIRKNINAANEDKMVEISNVELERISQLQTANEVLAVVKQFESRPPTHSLIIYLDTIQDPGNLGTIIRIADWFGIRDIVCSVHCADMYNPKVVQSSMASLANINIFYDEEDKWLPKQKLPLYATALNGRSVYDFEKIEKGILLIGNESKGIRKEFMDLAKERITIPKKGNAESLNAAVATGIILSHLVG